jgi:hypothetical protein
MRVKCLSVQQPWAELIVLGRKRIENRSWRVHHRGPLAIHASSSRATWDAVGPERLDRWLPGWREQPPVFGAVVGIVELVAVCRYADLPPALAAHEFTQASARWCWVLDQPRRLPVPVYLPGNSTLFHVEIPVPG